MGITSAAALPEPLPAVELVEHCRAFTEDPESLAGRQCDAYIRGFFAGLLAEGIVAGAADESSRETFAERAARTRLGITPRRPEFCLAEGMSIDRIVEQLIVYAARRALDGLAAQELLHGLLTVEFRCAGRV